MPVSNRGKLPRFFTFLREGVTVTDIRLLIITVVALLFAVFDEFVVDSALHSLIFIVLLLMLLYKNITSRGRIFASTLILILGLIVFYLAYIRTPRLLFKEKGFYGNVFIYYFRIKNINLSEDGYLVVNLGNVAY
ncbi:MAG: DUF986 family protein [Sodalis sp. (in: enterobacteria)]